jgi:hypothetical protein
MAQGIFSIHADPDDWVEPTMLEELHAKAQESGADMTICDIMVDYADRNVYAGQCVGKGDAEYCLNQLMYGKMHGSLCNKLIRTALYTQYNIRFIEGISHCEDFLICVQLFLNRAKVAYLPKAFYHYVKLNTGAFSQTYSARHLQEVRYNADRICHYIQACYGHQLDKELAFLKLEVKFPFLIGDDQEKYRLWTEWYPEANRYICENRYVSARSRLLQWCAWKGQFWAVRLYYILINKLVYGIIYK